MGFSAAIQKPFRRPVFLVISLLLLGVVLVSGPIHSTGTSLQSPKTVVLDPGHGGRESGAVGPGGTMEKGVALTLAQQIRSELGEKYRIVLTRSDDYWMAITDRAATANNLKADLFISLHAGGGYDSRMDGMTVFICCGIAGKSDVLDGLENSPTGLMPWDFAHLRHAPESRRLANVLRRSLSERFPLRQIPIAEAPLAVLAGADMPAALIEIGYLTHPASELNLKESPRIVDLARAIANGIDNFFQNKSG